ncbi:MAG: hypothetical protein AAGG44_06195 [Planctomycetota bacterium]
MSSSRTADDFRAPSIRSFTIGIVNAERIAMTVITTTTSTNVKPERI